MNNLIIPPYFESEKADVLICAPLVRVFITVRWNKSVFIDKETCNQKILKVEMGNIYMAPGFKKNTNQ